MDKKTFIICFGPKSSHQISLERLGKKYEIITTSDMSGISVIFSKNRIAVWDLVIIDLSLGVKISLLKKYIPNCGFPILFFSYDFNQKIFVEEIEKLFPQQKIFFCLTSELDEKIESILG